MAKLSKVKGKEGKGGAAKARLKKLGGEIKRVIQTIEGMVLVQPRATATAAAAAVAAAAAAGKGMKGEEVGEGEGGEGDGDPLIEITGWSDPLSDDTQAVLDALKALK